MKTKNIVVGSLLIIGLSLPFLSFTDYGYPDHTGAPKQMTCGMSGCHASHGIDQGPATIELTSNIPQGGFEGGQTYQITATISQANITAFGFQVMAWGQHDSSSVGTLAAGTQNRAQVVGSWEGPNMYATHKPASISATNNSNSWTFDWTAPDANNLNDTVTLYAAFVAANANGQSTGDYAYTKKLTVYSKESVGVSEISKASFKIYPNPSADGKVFLDLSSVKGDVENIVVSDYTGKQLQNVFVNKGTACLSLEIKQGSGIYFVRVNTKEASFTSKVIIE
ncbi:MAG: T9SS type A sorting domain-containing protein [Bacteroidetes bacterium]|nr:T9SS type A sorting domain-containing protein [Bacteroidota bacterium]